MTNTDALDLHYTKLSPRGEVEGSYITPSTQLILKAAEALGVRWREIPGTRIFELQYNGTNKLFRYQISINTTDIGFYTCLDKSVTNTILKANEISVPNGFHLEKTDTEEYWLEAFHSLTKPTVIKPTHGNKGIGISVGVTEEADFLERVRAAFALFENDSEAGVIIEEQCQGEEFRVIATKGKVLGVLQRIPANVVGDGIHTIQELIAEKNTHPYRNIFESKLYPKIKADALTEEMLREQGLSLMSILEKNYQVFLRKVSNISQGGDSVDLTSQIHPTFAEVANKVANSLPGIDFMGIDIMTADIRQSVERSPYHVIEVNSSPGFDIHEFPMTGKRQFIALEFVLLAFPELRPRLATMTTEQLENLY